jgi:hypothetical protein
MSNVFPDLSLALAHHPPQSEGDWSNRGILNETHDTIRRFLSLLKDHDAFSQSTIGVIVNRWGVDQPPKIDILPRIWVLNLCAHLSFLNCDMDIFQSGLTRYLTVARQIKTSFTDWIFRFLPMKKVIWIRRSTDIKQINYSFLLKNYIAQIEIPAMAGIETKAPIEGLKGLWGSEEWKDKSRFLWFPGNASPLREQGREQLKLPTGYETGRFGKFIQFLEEPPEAARQLKAGDRRNRIRSLRKLLYYHNLIPYWTDIIYIPSSGNLDKEGKSEGSGGLILFEKLPDNTPTLTNHWFRWTLERVKFLHSAAQQFYSFFIRQDRERISRHYALRSAIAAIMARNMDHLIGSHIETSAALQMSELREEIHNIAYELYQEKVIEIGVTSPPAESKGVYADDYWEASATGGTPVSGELTTRAFLDETVRGLEREYSNYRIKRMDLIARFSTEWIPWGVGMSFYHQVMLPFMRNGLLLHFLGFGEGIRLRDIDIQVNYPVSDCTDCRIHTCTQHCAKIQYSCGKQAPFYSLMIGTDDPIQFSMPQFDLMKIRGGDIGAHAFHIILENILRNSAKHGRLAESPKIRLNLWVIYDNPEKTFDSIGFTPAPSRREKFFKTVKQDNHESWFVVISSSADYPETSTEPKLFDEMDQLLRRPLTGEISGPDPEAWGMKEKKICAAYLANVQPEETNSPEPNYIYAGSISSKATGSRSYLSYCVRIPRANFLLSIDC